MVVRDVGAWVVAGAILLKQAGILLPPPAEVSETLCIVAAVLLGGPGVLHGVEALRGGGALPPSPSVEPEPLPSSPGESSPTGEPA